MHRPSRSTPRPAPPRAPDAHALSDPPTHAKPLRWAPTLALWEEYLSATPALPQLDRWLARALKERPQFGKKDRAWYSEALFALARFGLLSAWVCALERALPPRPPARLSADEQARLRAELDARATTPEGLVALWREAGAARLLWVSLRRAGLPAPPPFAFTDEERARLEAAYALAEQRLGSSEGLWGRALWQGAPPWAAEALEARAARSGWGEGELGRFLEAQATRPPLWLRLNCAERERPELRARVVTELRGSNFRVELDEARPQALAVYGDRPIFELEGFKRGWFEIQDAASQEIGRAVSARPGQRVWDACAGAGGKTLQLASALANRGVVIASDVRAHALEDARQRVRRADFQNVRFALWGEEGALPDFGPEHSKWGGGFDWVLVDAPCSASGTWRRNPDAKLRFALSGEAPPDAQGRPPRRAQEFATLQLSILRRASAAVRPGAHLVYGTCSFLVEENEAVVEAFLNAEPSFTLVSMSLHGAPALDADTTFSAVLRRAST